MKNPKTPDSLWLVPVLILAVLLIQWVFNQ